MARGAFEAWRDQRSEPSDAEPGASAVVFPKLGLEPAMQSLLVSLTTVGLAEIGDRTQLLSLMLAARYRKPRPIIAGVLVATLANHGLSGLLGRWLGGLVRPGITEAAVGVSMLAMALWTLKPDKLDAEGEKIRDTSVFVTTLIAFFIAETGDKTQIATLALAAAYPSLLAVIAGTTCGMLLANGPVVFLGKAFADRLPLKALHIGAAALFAVLGVVFIVRGVT